MAGWQDKVISGNEFDPVRPRVSLFAKNKIELSKIWERFVRQTCKLGTHGIYCKISIFLLKCLFLAVRAGGKHE